MKALLSNFTLSYTILFLFLLSACVGGRISESEAKRFDGSLQDFLRLNFKPRWIEDDIKGDRARFGDKGIYYIGYAGGGLGGYWNTGYITKPRDDLRTYCMARGGSFDRISSNEFASDVVNVITKYRDKRAPIKTLGQALSVRESLIEAGYTPAAAKSILNDMLDENLHRSLNDLPKTIGIASVLIKLEQEGAFGHYVCRRVDEKMWHVKLSLLNLMNVNSSASSFQVLMGLYPFE